jgi:hypothetical protein
MLRAGPGASSKADSGLNLQARRGAAVALLAHAFATVPALFAQHHQTVAQHAVDLVVLEQRQGLLTVEYVQAMRIVFDPERGLATALDHDLALELVLDVLDIDHPAFRLPCPCRPANEVLRSVTPVAGAACMNTLSTPAPASSAALPTFDC